MVVVLGCIEGLIPFLDQNAPRLEQDRALAEQRRLFYVAITRTKGCLVLSSVTTLPTKDAYRMNVKIKSSGGGASRTIATRFLSELGPELPASIAGPDFLSATKQS
ncbi:MAG: hypothetical protein JNL08_00890 [Planctomycetes bacterium]|nr:hypothetical protein [Planctomycetota bacterium]